MSITKVYSVFCDGGSALCHGWISETTLGSTAARREARAAGWKRTGGRDLCPACYEAEGECGTVLGLGTTGSTTREEAR